MQVDRHQTHRDISTPSEGRRIEHQSSGTSAPEKVSEPSTLKPRPRNSAHYGLEDQAQEGEQKGLEAWAAQPAQEDP